MSISKILTKGPSSPGEWLELLDFWQSYPLWLGKFRAAIRNDGEELEVLAGLPESTKSRVAYEQILFKVPRSTELFLFLRVGVSGKSAITVFAERGVRMPGETPYYEVTKLALAVAHEQYAEPKLAKELERRGMDSSAIVLSGRICRHVCGLIPDLGPMKSRWPSCAAGVSLHLSDMQIVGDAERSIMRLKTQLENECDPPPAPTPQSPAANPTTEMSLDARATAVLIEHPEWDNNQIAGAAKCNPKSLNKRRTPNFMRARQSLKSNREEHHQGTKYDGEVEAECDDEIDEIDD